MIHQGDSAGRRTVQIEPWTEGDLQLLERLTGDPAMMAHLGGPESRERIAERHARYVAGSDSVFKIVAGAGGEDVGWVGFWQRTWHGREIYEMGWAVIPAFQGRGIAHTATMQALEVARSQRNRRFLHAFPSVDNTPSNAICRRLGFTLLEACEFEYPPGRFTQCNDWCLDLFARSRPTAAAGG